MELAYLFVSFVHLASSARLSNEKRFWHTIWEFRLKSSLANVHDLNIKRDDDVCDTKVEWGMNVAFH
ncbi:hypothetical protein T4C_9174 [Trichinella pseudospiralis]|uniref:Secreted protein n=1 Tax=Trichinella pseudospiralis TaxID=6337 RepID=A0A0V1J9F2_TRIPS|nr:hypothetical protein T4C_9174 [Trichinella pseudospiralis]